VRVAILDDFHSVYEQTAAVRRLRERCEVTIFTSPFGDPSKLRGFDAVIANRERTRFTHELLDQLPDLRIIAQTGNHANHIDLDAARQRGVIVARTGRGFSVGAAELAIGLAIALMRRIPSSDTALKQGEWHTPSTPVLNKKTLGIIGLGRVGRHVARIANAFGMRVVAWSPRLTEKAAAEAGAEMLPMDELLTVSDVVSIHASLKPESRGLIDARRIGLMKPTAYLINTARGPIVEESALIDALENKRIAGAGLDVFDVEPLPAGHPLTRLSNVVLTPHIGWPTDQGYEQFAEGAVEVLIDYLEGREVRQF
jgi:phosphoglycerate dehydrogenase-like enzyme